jgi:hypothetical protein
VDFKSHFNNKTIVKMNLSRVDIDQLIKNFNASPSKNDYTIIYDWYTRNSENSNVDSEYLLCVYLFLLGANIKQQYIPFSKDQHRLWVVEITKLIENAELMYQTQRKAYLNFGTRAGYYK